MSLPELITLVLQLGVLGFAFLIFAALFIAFLRDWSIGKPESHPVHRLLRGVDRWLESWSHGGSSHPPGSR